MFRKETATKILIVEDDYAIADNLRVLLQLKGYQVSHAADGQTAVELAREEMPHVMLLDIMIPRLSGFDVCRLIKSEAGTHAIKVIVITSLGRMGDVEKAFTCGASDYVIKPIDTERLLGKIEKVLS